MKFLRPPRFRNQAGDTIVEVMIVLAVLGLAFSISYATASHGLAQSRNAEEHSEALGMLNTQVELVRTALAKRVVLPVDTTPPAGNTSLNFCMSDATAPPTIVGFGNYTVPSNPKLDTAITNVAPQPTYPAACVSGFYHMSIVYDPGTGSYDFRIRWDGVNNLGRQQEEFNYKITPVAAAFADAPYDPSPVLNTPTLQVQVKKIQKNADNTAPSCASGNAKVNLSGVVATLSPGGQSGSTGAGGLTSITDLVDGQAYSATVASADYTFCSSTSTTATTVTPYNQVSVVVASKCTLHPASTGPAYNHYTTAYSWVHTGPDDYYDWRNMPPTQSSPPIAYYDYEYSGRASSGPVYYTWYSFFYTLNPPAYADIYAYYFRSEYQPYSVYLGYYGDPIAAYNTCT